MKRYYYDFHTHSCLSPCADDDNTPNNIAGMATVSELDIVALTDHNTCKNCPAFFEACERYSITAVAGMELTTAEDIHVVCLFEQLSDALRFDEYVEDRRMKIKNREEIFGNQLIMNSADEIIGKDEFLLSAATDIPLEEVPALVKDFGGICYPAHIDRDANGIINILGTIPDTPSFDFYEVRDEESIEIYSEKYNIPKNSFLVDSDAHFLEGFRDKEFCISLPEAKSSDEVRKNLFKFLRRSI